MRCVRARTIAMVILTALATLVLPSRLFAQDFYYYRDSRIPLTRATTECLVAFTATAPTNKQAVLQRIQPELRLGAEVTTGGRTYFIVSFGPEVRDVPVVGGLTGLLQRSPEIAFAAPVFYEPTTTTRMLVTDEIVVKLKEGTTRSQLEAICLQERLAVAESLPGTRDQFVLRIETPGPDALEVSRRLHDSGQFDWVEPNFIRELAR